jgi:parallel beta-helix repeat protein
LSYDNNIDSSWCIAQNSWSGSQGDKGTPGELNDCVTTEHYLMVQSPNGYEEWHVMQHDTVRWIGVGFEGGVKIELNRSYPSSTWEILVNSTENDSEEAVFVADLLSDQCRVKVSALEDTLFDISDGDFSIKGPLYGGAVSGIWTADYSPVYICDNATVASDDTLIIEPGVIVEFLGHYQFTVNGLLLAIGTEQDPIIFTTDTLINPPRWGGLTFSGSSSSQSQLAYCVIEHVDRSSFVGGVYCHNASPTFANCIISGNSTNGYGGGIYCENNSDPHFTACTISGNQADYDGGGIYCYDSSPVFIDCIISGNRAAFSGGGIFSAYASPSFSNCTVTSNSAFYGGGIACWYGNALSATNTIIWGNCAVCAGDELYLHDAGSSIAFHCCDVDSSGINGEGTLIWLEGNIFGDPLFCNPDTCDNAPTTAGDYHIYDVSPCAPAQQSECTLIGALNAGCSRAPMPVGDLTIAVQAVDATLFWSPVADTMSGNPVQVDFYLIFYSQYPEGPYFFRGATADTCYTHSGAVQFADAMFYQVTAYVGSIGFLEKALAELGEHPKREDLNSRLQKPFAGKR